MSTTEWKDNPVFSAGVSSVGGAIQTGIRAEQYGEQPSA